MKNLIKSFGYAFQGIFTALTKERNMRIHMVCMIYMFFFLFAFDFFEITRTQLAILLLACGQVIAAELINTAIEAIIDEVIASNPSQVEQYKSGKVGLLGFFVGNVMKKTGGTANPSIVNEMLRKKLA